MMFGFDGFGDRELLGFLLVMGGGVLAAFNDRLRGVGVGVGAWAWRVVVCGVWGRFRVFWDRPKRLEGVISDFIRRYEGDEVRKSLEREDGLVRLEELRFYVTRMAGYSDVDFERRPFVMFRCDSEGRNKQVTRLFKGMAGSADDGDLEGFSWMSNILRDELADYEAWYIPLMQVGRGGTFKGLGLETEGGEFAGRYDVHIYPVSMINGVARVEFEGVVEPVDEVACATVLAAAGRVGVRGVGCVCGRCALNSKF